MHKESLRRDDSPTKNKGWRPSTAYVSPNKRKSQLNYTLDEANALGASIFTYPGINIIKELNGKEIKAQDKDIEIERLKTTCFNLNNKAIVAEDLQRDLELMKKRLEESEAARRDLEKQNEMQEKQNRNLQDENAQLRGDLQSTIQEKAVLQ